MRNYTSDILNIRTDVKERLFISDIINEDYRIEPERLKNLKLELKATSCLRLGSTPKNWITTFIFQRKPRLFLIILQKLQI